MQEPFDLLPGVIKTMQIIYSPYMISYEKLLKVFCHNIDPAEDNGQFCDTGNQYRAGIFYHNEEQKRLAEQSRALLEKNKPFTGSIMTFITAATDFYPAEDKHQNFSRKYPLTYKFYRFTCGRDKRLYELRVKS